MFDWLCVASSQWLVKRAIETREEMGDYVRAYSISQFHKSHTLPEVTEALSSCSRLHVQSVSRPSARWIF